MTCALCASMLLSGHPGESVYRLPFLIQEVSQDTLEKTDPSEVRSSCGEIQSEYQRFSIN